LRQRYLEASAVDIYELTVGKPARARAAAAKAAREEEQYRRQDVQRFIDSKLAQVSEVEMKEHFLGDRERKPKFQIHVTGLPGQGEAHG
jgi:hypothetical protein